MCQFEVEWEKFLCVWENVLCNAITLIEIKSVDPASGQNRDKIVSLLLTFFFLVFFFENTLWRKKKINISASLALVITKKLKV